MKSRGRRRGILEGREPPLLFAHRGLSAVAPENTMAAFRLAEMKGCPGIELDIHLSSDGKLVVFHDDTTARTAPDSVALSGSPAGFRIDATPWETLRHLDVGSWKGKDFSDQRPILLGELFSEFGDRIYYDIELKSRDREDHGLEKALARELALSGLSRVCVLSSFNPFALLRARAAMPEIPTGIIWCTSTELPWILRRGEGRWLGKADFIKPDHALISAGSRLFWNLTGSGPVMPWTVDEPGEAARLLALGVRGLISNNPPALGVPGLKL